MPDMRRVLVTGAAGFIGSHVVERLLVEGVAVVGFDNLSSGKLKWLQGVVGHPSFRLATGDLRNLDDVVGAMSGCDTVWHLGANTDIPGGALNSRLDLENGILATFHVLEAMRNSSAFQLLFASSGAVFGTAPIVPTPETIGPLLPMSIYGASKMSCEGLISAYAHTYGVRAWIFRFGNVVGARMSHGVIYDFVRKLRANPRELEILGDGNQRKNYFLVEDCVGGMLFAFRCANVEPCDVYHLGNSSTITASEIAEIVVNELGLHDVHFHFTGGSQGWPGDQPVAVFDVSKMRSLGWEVQKTSAEVVRIAVRQMAETALPAS